MISKRAYVPAIDVVRCFAALSVTLFHLAITWPHVAVPLKVLPPYPDMSFLNGYLYFGFVGVEIFFVISGFVIAASCPRDGGRATSSSAAPCASSRCCGPSCSRRPSSISSAAHP